MTREDLNDEIEAINAIYPDSLVESGSMFQLLIPDRDIILQISFPSTYPVDSPHILSVSSKTYSSSDLNKELVEDLLSSVFISDNVCLFEFIEHMREVFEEPQELEPDIGEVDAYQMTKQDIEQQIFKYWVSSAPIVDRKSTFIGFSSEIHSQSEFFDRLSMLKADRHIQRSTHNITAYRIKNDNGTIIQDCDDDGETAAGSRLLHLLAVSRKIKKKYICKDTNICVDYRLLECMCLCVTVVWRYPFRS